MSLTAVWLDTLGDGLLRADAIIGVRTHRTPAIAGKPAHWLIDVVLPTSTGSGLGESWTLSPLHQTLIQADQEPLNAPQQLVRLLAQLDAANATGIITCEIASNAATDSRGNTTGPAAVRFHYQPFSTTQTGRHYDAEYL